MSGSTVALVGFGNMGRALAAGWVANGRDPRTITVLDPSVAAREAATAAGLHVAEAVPAVDVVVIAVKPAEVDDALGSADPSSTAVYLSIAAGRTVASLARTLGASAAVVRAMPNTPAAIGRGVTGLFASPAVSASQRGICQDLMSAVGSVVWVESESLIDAVTAISGSGPAYVFLLIESLAAAGVALGLDQRTAATLALHTVAGSGEYARAESVDAAQLRRRVTSPNGTTQAALEILMGDDGLEQLIKRATEAAMRRSRELGRGA